MNKTIANKQLIVTLLVIFTSFSVLIANAQENEMNSEKSYVNSFQATTIETEIEAETPSLAICDHNDDQLRNLTDVAMFATCKDTFDANNDGEHDLSDISLYTSMNQDADFCNGVGPISFDCTPDSIATSNEAEDAVLAICDHNDDNVRNLSDIAIFAGCQDTFDANNDGEHDLSDISLYTSMNQDNNFCDNTFKCKPIKPTLPVSGVNSVGATADSESISICDHNNDNVRNLSDIAIFAGCKETFDADNDGDHDLSDISLYTSMNQNNTFCKDTFKCQPDKKTITDIKDDSYPALRDNTEDKKEVLGVKENLCNVDQDVLGQTQWADGSLIRGCDMKIYRIENQEKHYIKNLKELLKYIGQRIYNVTDEVVTLFQ